jgi:HD superfamily phosphohydrolase
MDFFQINDPISGFIFIPKKFLNLIDSEEIQRLRRIKQLSGAPYVYPGANHTRFEHSIGVMASVQKILDILIKAGKIELEQDLYNSTIIAGSFSHNFEEILLSKLGMDHEDFTNKIINKSEIGDKINELGLNKRKVADLSVGRLNLDGYQYLDQIIAGAINCDSMDYLARDAYHCGTAANLILRERIMTLADITPGYDLGFHIKGVITLESFLLLRLNSFRSIYFHKTCRAVQLMLGRAMIKFNNDTSLLSFKDSESLLKWDDINLFNELQNNEASKPIIDRLKKRDLIKCCYEKPSMISKGDDKPKTGNPTKIALEIAQKAKVNPEDIYIDFPMMTSVPYQHSTNLKQNEIPSFSFDDVGNKKMELIEQHSLFFEQIKGYYNLVRVYTDKKNKERVNEAAKKVLMGVTLDDWLG